MTKALFVVITVVIFTITAKLLAGLFVVPTYEVYGPLAIGAIAVLSADVYTKGSD